MTNFNPSVQQTNLLKTMLESSSNITLQARAGCGKSTTIVWAASFFPTKKSIFLSFGKKNQLDLEEKLAQAVIHNAVAKTFHSIGYAAQCAHNRQFKKFKNKGSNKVGSLFLSTVSDEKQEKWLPAITKTISLAKNRAIGVPEVCSIDDHEEWSKLIEQFGTMDEVDCDESIFIEICIKVLKMSNNQMDVIDFDDQLYMPLLFSWKLPSYDIVYVDEAQDSNLTRILLAKKLAGNGRLVFVGDSYQAIMGFTGSDNDALEQLTTKFNCVTLPLSTTFRCPKSVIEKANELVSDIEAHETNIEGSVSEVPYAELTTKAKVGDVILCRLNRYLVKLFFKFLKSGVKAKIEGKDQINGLMWLASQFGKDKPLSQVMGLLEDYRDKRVDELNEKRNYVAADNLSDRVDCVLSVIEHLVCEGYNDLKDLKATLTDMFGDDIDRSQVISLCSCHKSKGLEWDNVFILGYEQFMPHKRAEKEWEKEQERNLQYVAITRAKKNLYFVNDVPSKL